jgi:uncharacterized membrane protein
VSFYAWMLSLHLIAAFLIAAALTLYSVLVFAGRRAKTAEDRQTLFRIAPIGAPLITIGSLAALILGIVLAIDADDIKIWDGWVIAAIVLWAALGGVGQRTGAYYTEVQKLAEGGGPDEEVVARLQAPTGMLLHLATLGIFVLLLLDMIFKPGA